MSCREYEYSDRTKKIPASQFGLAGRHQLPIQSDEYYAKLIDDVMTKKRKKLLTKQAAKKLIKKYDKILEKDWLTRYKNWLAEYHKFTAALEKLHVRFSTI